MGWECCLYCIPWRTVLRGSSLGREPPRGWVIWLSVSQSIRGWMHWHIMATLNFCSFLSTVGGSVPGVLEPVWGQWMPRGWWLTMAVQSQPGSTGTKCPGTKCRCPLGRPTFERSSVGGVQFLCISYSCYFAVISWGFDIGLSWLSWRKTLPTVKGWNVREARSAAVLFVLLGVQWKPVVPSCANGNCITPCLELCYSWQLT